MHGYFIFGGCREEQISPKCKEKIVTIVACVINSGYKGVLSSSGFGY